MLGTYTGPAPGIPRLGIKPYQWGTECLSGDVRAGPATSFPQSIGMVRLQSCSSFQSSFLIGQFACKRSRERGLSRPGLERGLYRGF